MILVVGGKSQGKRAFAQTLSGTDGADRWQDGAGRRQGSVILRQDHSIQWTDGARADWEAFMKGRYCCNFHLFIRRVLSGELEFANCGTLRGPGHESQLEEYVASALMKGNPDRILVTDEIGYGIVPMDAFERRYREETGRICCLAAKQAEQVWRVCCGIGQRIK